VASSTERSRRLRAHRKGDHSLCLATCDGTAVAVASATRATPVGLGARGRKLWRELTADEPGPAERLLIEEACRIADRLDKLDAQLRGDAEAWLRFVVDDTGAEVTITIDRALAEARQQAVALKALLAELRQAAPKAAARPGRGGTVQPAAAAEAAEVRGVTDLTARIRDRRAQA